MSLNPADPARTHALLVGIEIYAAGANWNLDGPALDVLAVHEWLTSHDVPAAQIRTFVSALPANQVRLDNADIRYRTASSNLVRAALSDLKKEDGDLLVIFWAGHGAINDRQHRLFFSDASIEEKYNLEWEALRNALTSTAFEGFARQVVIIDACADFRNDFDYTAPGEAIPSGKPLERELFAVFATSEGQTAANLGQDRRGLFSRELLRVLSADEHKAAWPPDMEAVADAVKKRFKELEREGVTQTPRFEVRDWVGVDRVFGGRLAPALRTGETARHLALVIGISRYLHGVPANQTMTDAQFTHLASPADDARALHQFLAAQSGYEVEDPLLDEDATLAGILRAVDRLRKRCRQGGQTALIYFSGHGVTDDEDRTFLVPHDARRDDLFASALWSKTLNGVLEEFTNSRLVMLLDACHAGGTIGVGGAKSSALPGFDPGALASGSTPASRFVVASCMARQRSYEADGRGIFTAELMELLRVNDPNLFSEEEVDLFDLYKALRARVTQSAAARCGGVVQQPFANFGDHTGIVMAINTALRTERQRRRTEYLEALIRCVEPVAGGRARVDCKQRLTFQTKLRNYVTAGRRTPQLNRVCEYFDERLQNTDPDDLEAVIDDCTELVRLFEEANPGARPPLHGSRPAFDRAPAATSAAPAPAKAAAPVVAPTMGAPSPANANALVLGARLPVLSPTPPAQAPGLAPGPAIGSQDERRVLNEADVPYILQDIWNDTRLFREAGDLRAILTRVEGVSSKDVTLWLLNVKPKTPPEGWEPMKDTIAVRFAERFQTAKQPERASTLSIRVGRGD